MASQGLVVCRPVQRDQRRTLVAATAAGRRRQAAGKRPKQQACVPRSPGATEKVALRKLLEKCSLHPSDPALGRTPSAPG